MRLATWVAAALVAGPTAFLCAVLVWRRGAHALERAWLPIVAVAAAAGSTLGGSPTGAAGVDDVERAVALVAVALLGALAPVPIVAGAVAAAGLAAVGTPGGALAVVGLGALVGALACSRPNRLVTGLAASGAVAATWTLPADLHGARPALAALVAVVLVLGGLARTERRVRAGVAIGLGGLALLVVVAGVLSIGPAQRSARRARAGEAAARAGLAAARGLDRPAAEAHLRRAADAFASIDRSLSSPGPRALLAVPVVAQHVRLGRDAGRAGAALTADAGAVLAGDAASALAPHGGAVDVAALQRLGTRVDGLAARLGAGRAALRADDGPWVLASVRRRLASVDRQLADAQRSLGPLADAAGRLPAVLGADGSRRYLIVFTAPAEVRGSQGIVGSYAEVEAEGGRLRLTAVGRDADLNTAGTPVAERSLEGTDPGWRAAWAAYGPLSAWQNITMDPDFPRSALAMAVGYPQSGGRPVDGVIALDPAGVAALLRLTGPVTSPGFGTVTSADAVPLLGIEQYRRLPEQAQRVAALSALTRATFDKLTAVTGDALRGGAPCAATAGSRRHLLVWLRRPEEQALVRRAHLDGAFPTPDPAQVQAGATLTNSAGNKLDWWVHHDVAVHAVEQADGQRVAEVTVHLRNDAPTSGWPDYVLRSVGPHRADPPGTTSLLVTAYGSDEVASATLDGASVTVDRVGDGPRRLARAVVQLAPGADRTLVVRFRAPGSARVVALPRPPAADDQPC